MFPNGINRRYAIFAGFVLVMLWLWVAFDRPYSLPSHFSWNPYSNTGQSDLAKDIFDFPAIESNAIREVCGRTEWNSSVIFTCDNNHGGVGHVRNSILNCVRFAISAGAGLVLPNIALRDMEDDTVIIWDEPVQEPMRKRHGPGRRGMEHMFDVPHFLESLHLSCPKMPLFEDMGDSFGGRRRGLLPESLVDNHPTSGLEHPEQWRKMFYGWVDKYMVKPSDYTRDEPIIVDLDQSFLVYPTHSDSHEFAHDFGKILKFREDTRRLATAALVELLEWHDSDGDIRDPIMNPSFFGAHIRTEPEVSHESDLLRRHDTPQPFMEYNAQATAYLTQAQEGNMSIIYATSGNLSNMALLRHHAMHWDIEVTHKFALLKDNHRDELERLTWDQRALIDFMVLTKAQSFGGVAHSFFSWNLALKRHQLAKEAGLEKDGKHSTFSGKGVLSEDGTWSDGLSHIYGNRKSYFESSKCMWE
ncbi:hypothetical protein HYALB_00004644 [Hymenoscyphus albidus]|uniref:Alternative oxidase n=1 Tax=Hymenoscyphus albidus TaxID=595503 RepID=A0A9N9M1H3_9HELO|nr:hypothetical protein HYALB_00004644 [Hymenoscyphus albidus]